MIKPTLFSLISLSISSVSALYGCDIESNQLTSGLNFKYFAYPAGITETNPTYFEANYKTQKAINNGGGILDNSFSLTTENTMFGVIPQSYILEFTGYFKPKISGIYTVLLDEIADNALLFLGEGAFNCGNENVLNSDESSYLLFGSTPDNTNTQTYVILNAGIYYPFRIVTATNGSFGSINYFFIDPNGDSISDLSDYIFSGEDQVAAVNSIVSKDTVYGVVPTVSTSYIKTTDYSGKTVRVPTEYNVIKPSVTFSIYGSERTEYIKTFDKTTTTIVVDVIVDPTVADIVANRAVISNSGAVASATSNTSTSDAIVPVSNQANTESTTDTTTAPASNIDTSVPASNIDTSVPASNTDATVPVSNQATTIESTIDTTTAPASNTDATVPASNNASTTESTTDSSISESTTTLDISNPSKTTANDTDALSSSTKELKNSFSSKSPAGPSLGTENPSQTNVNVSNSITSSPIVPSNTIPDNMSPSNVYVWTDSTSSTISLFYYNDDISVPSGGLFKRDIITSVDVAVLIPTPSVIGWDEPTTGTTTVTMTELIYDGTFKTITVEILETPNFTATSTSGGASSTSIGNLLSSVNISTSVAFVSSTSTTQSDSVSTNQFDSVSTNQSDSVSTTQSDSTSTTQSDSVSTNQSDSVSTNQSDSVSTNQSDSVSTNQPDSVSTTQQDSASTTQPDSASTTQANNNSLIRESSLTPSSGIFVGTSSVTIYGQNHYIAHETTVFTSNDIVYTAPLDVVHVRCTGNCEITSIVKDQVVTTSVPYTYTTYVPGHVIYITETTLVDVHPTLALDDGVVVTKWSTETKIVPCDQTSSISGGDKPIVSMGETVITTQTTITTTVKINPMETSLLSSSSSPVHTDAAVDTDLAFNNANLVSTSVWGSIFALLTFLL